LTAVSVGDGSFSCLRDALDRHGTAGCLSVSIVGRGVGKMRLAFGITFGDTGRTLDTEGGGGDEVEELRDRWSCCNFTIKSRLTASSEYADRCSGASG